MEKFDLLDSDRRPTGETVVRGEKIPEGRYHVSVHICLFNNEGELLIQRRTNTKESFPGMWDVSVGGSAIAGETSREAALREVHEELGFDADLPARPALSTTFFDGYDDLYLGRCNLAPDELTLQSEEVEEARYASLETVLAMIADGRFIPYRKPYIELIFAMRDQLKSEVNHVLT